MTDEFTFAPAVRKNVHIIIALAGASGSGKTKTALELAYGLAGGDETKIGMIDTEAKRGLHYARTEGETRESAPNKYGFLHSDMQPPFRPERFERGIEAAVNAGLKVLIIDSFSHEYDGEGGILDWAADLEAGTPKPGIDNPRDPKDGDGWKDWLEKPLPGPGNWKEPKAAHKHLVQTTVLQARCHLIFCLRAEEKVKILKKGDTMANGQTARSTAVESAGWMPICEKKFMYEMTLSLTLRPDQPGMPQFDLPHKMQDQHRPFFPEGERISREAGSRLAAWAAGAPPPAADPITAYGRELNARLKAATEPGALLDWWKATMSQRTELEIPNDRLGKMQQAVTERVEQLKANSGQQEETTQ